MTHHESFEMKRRDLLKAGGALVVTLAFPAGLTMGSRSTYGAVPDPRDLDPTQLDTWLAVGNDGFVTAYFGKIDMGQGLETAMMQAVAEELDVAFDNVKVIMGDTALTLHQGGASASSACRQSGFALRNAAAEARRVLLEKAAAQWGVAVDGLSVADGVITGAGREITYGALIGGQRFEVTMEWNNRYGNGLLVEGSALLKDPSTHRVLGLPIPRNDIPGKVFATTEFAADVTLPGMMHGRSIRPPVANAVPVAVDNTSIRDIPGGRVIWRRDYVGVVANTEWGAIKAAEQLKVTWSEPGSPAFPTTHAELFDHIRSVPPVMRNAGGGFGAPVEVDEGPINAALAAADRVIEAEYEIPYQSHAAMGPSQAVVDVTYDSATFWFSGQKPYQTRQGLAAFLGLDIENVRGIFMPGPGSYGRGDHDESVYEAALLSQAIGRPVRVQWMRHEGHGWDTKGPAAVITLRAGLDANNNVIAHSYKAKGATSWEVWFDASNPSDTIVGQQTGWPSNRRENYGSWSESYEFAATYKFWRRYRRCRTERLRCARRICVRRRDHKSSLPLRALSKNWPRPKVRTRLSSA